MEIKDNVLIQVTDDDIENGTFTIPENIDFIRRYAFEECKKLENIRLSDKVTEIGYAAFKNCYNLKEIILSNNITKIEKDTFKDCINLKNVELPRLLKQISEGLFKNCSSITKIEIPNGVTTIDSCAFYGCQNLKEITIPEGVTHIGYGVFCDCKHLTEITIPESVTHIGMNTFYKCKNLTNLTIPKGVTEIRDCTFCGCTSLTSITISESIIKIGMFAFEDCASLTSITIPKGVIRIEQSAFKDCTNLTSLIIPESIIRIGYSAFEGCQNLSLNIKTSLFSAYKEFKTFNVKELTIYNIKVNLDNIETSLREIREEELQDKINYALLDNHISDPKCFKLSEHKKFINKIIENIEQYDYDYRQDFDNYIENYVNEHKPKELVEIKNIQSMLIDINNYNIDNKDLNNSIVLQQYGIELLDYPFFIATLLSKLQTNSTSNIETINLNRILTKITKLKSRNPDDISKLVEKVFFDVSEEGLVLNKTLMNKIINYTRYKVCSLNDGINGFETLKEIIRICIEKINVCKENLNNIEITDEKDIRLLNMDNNSIKNNVNAKIKAFNDCELMLSIYNERINNFITLNQIHIDKLKELVTHAIPSLLQTTISSKVVLKDKEDVKKLNNVCNTLRELIELEENSKIETNSLEVLIEGEEKTYKK